MTNTPKQSIAESSNLVARMLDDALAWSMATVEGAPETVGLLNEGAAEIRRLTARVAELESGVRRIALACRERVSRYSLDGLSTSDFAFKLLGQQSETTGK